MLSRQGFNTSTRSRRSVGKLVTSRHEVTPKALGFSATIMWECKISQIFGCV